jgi:polysaccharide deacetylase 2 family uncharacterized protein YibQ
MAKRKKRDFPKNDVKITAIVAGLFAAVVIFGFIFTKARESFRTVPPHQRTVERPAVTPEIPPVVNPPQPLPPSVPENIPGRGGKIALIIDDWGQSTSNCRYLKEIPQPMAVSVLPGLRHTKDVVKCAALYHKLTMLHLPLEALHNNDLYPANYIIKTSMNPSLVSRIVDEDMNQMPSIEGVNNHMGSKGTADMPLMKIILKKIKKKGLFFVDSMTSRYTVCPQLAEEMGVPFGKRDVFLDNINTREEITKQIVALAQKARRRGYAIAIGHDRHLTMQVLKDTIPLLEKQGFEFVSIKELLKDKS